MYIIAFFVIFVLVIALLSGISILYQKIKKNDMFKAEEVFITTERKEFIKNALLHAMQHNGFEVYYQPVFNKFDTIIAAEALLRLQNGGDEEITPQEFIQVAVELGMMEEIGLFVIDSVAEFIKNNDMEQLGIQYVEVNLSAAECSNKMLAQQINDILEKHGIDKSLINLQIAEKTLFDHHAVFIDNMKKLYDSGVQFSLDDYGANANTIAYIMALPFQFVKIDKSVLWMALQDKTAMQIFSSSIDTLKDFSMQIVVEGVETKETAERLKRIGCDYLQGYYYAKPLCMKDFKDFCLTMDKA